MSTNWRISSFHGALLAAYFIPTWTIVAYRIMVAPIHGLYERPNIAVGLFISDHLQLTGMTAVRIAWLLALGKLTVVAFFVLFLAFIVRAAIRKTGDRDEPLAIALTIGSVISFASMIMASQVGETAGAAAACDRTAAAARRRDPVAGRASRRAAGGVRRDVGRDRPRSARTPEQSLSLRGPRDRRLNVGSSAASKSRPPRR